MGCCYDGTSQGSSCQGVVSHAVKMVHLCLYHLKRQLSESLDPMLSSFQIAKEVGDVEIAAYCLSMPLEQLETQMNSYVEFCRQFRQEAVMTEILPLH